MQQEKSLNADVTFEMRKKTTKKRSKNRKSVHKHHIAANYDKNTASTFATDCVHSEWKKKGPRFFCFIWFLTDFCQVEKQKVHELKITNGQYLFIMTHVTEIHFRIKEMFLNVIRHRSFHNILDSLLYSAAFLLPLCSCSIIVRAAIHSDYPEGNPEAVKQILLILSRFRSF